MHKNPIFTPLCLGEGGDADSERGIIDFEVGGRKVVRYVDIKKHLFEQYLF